MPSETSSVPETGLDLYACQCRLVWANVRRVESAYLRNPLNARHATICWYVQTGAATAVQGTRRTTAARGEWLFPTNQSGIQEIEAGTRLISIRFLLRLRGSEPVFDPPEPMVFSAGEAPDLKPAALRLVVAARPWAVQGSLLMGRGHIPLRENFRIEAAFHNWMALYTETMFSRGATTRRGWETDDRVRLALTHLETFPLREKFSERELADLCGLGVNQLARLFKRNLGMTPFAYFDRRRLETARHALSETTLQVKEIAFDLGFSSSPHFSTWFKEREGTRPREFRNSGRRWERNPTP